jgi:hypothetical protein
MLPSAGLLLLLLSLVKVALKRVVDSVKIYRDHWLVLILTVLKIRNDAMLFADYNTLISKRFH